MEAATEVHRFLSLKKSCVGFLRADHQSTFWIRTGGFPSPKKLGPRKVGWNEREITEWMVSRESSLSSGRLVGLTSAAITSETAWNFVPAGSQEWLARDNTDRTAHN